MQKKNCLAYIVCFATEKGLKAFVSTNQFAIKKMAAAFKEVYIISQDLLLEILVQLFMKLPYLVHQVLILEIDKIKG